MSAQPSARTWKIRVDDTLVPIYAWTPPGRPLASIIALHGSVQHGRVYESLARHFTAENVAFYSVDMRGHGSSSPANAEQGTPVPVDYGASARDLVRVAGEIRKEHRAVPLFIVGESVGAAVALRAAQMHPRLFDGLVLASAGTRPKFGDWRLTLGAVKQGIGTLGSSIDLAAHIARISEDARSGRAMLADPNVRRYASLKDLLHTAGFIREAAVAAPKVSSRIPILMLQGKHDHVVCPESAGALYESLKSRDKNFIEYPTYGHVLVTGSFLKKDVLRDVTKWVKSRLSS